MLFPNMPLHSKLTEAIDKICRILDTKQDYIQPFFPNKKDITQTFKTIKKIMGTNCKK